MTELDWKNLDSWRTRLFEAYRDELPANLLDVALSHAPEGFYSDDIQWLDSIRLDAGLDPEPELDQVIAHTLSDTFGSIRTYHASRPLDVSECLDDGLLLRDSERLDELAYSIFAKLGVSREEIAAMGQQKSLADENGLIFLSLDDRDYSEYCGHYLIYGSEYLLAIAAGLYPRFGDEPRKLLRARGTPTVFQISLPTNLVDLSTLAELARNLLSTAFRTHCMDEKVAPDMDFTFRVASSITPENITDHYHPKSLRDPHEQYALYVPDRTRCSRCP